LDLGLLVLGNILSFAPFSKKVFFGKLFQVLGHLGAQDYYWGPFEKFSHFWGLKVNLRRYGSCGEVPEFGFFAPEGKVFGRIELAVTNQVLGLIKGALMVYKRELRGLMGFSICLGRL